MSTLSSLRGWKNGVMDGSVCVITNKDNCHSSREDPLIAFVQTESTILRLQLPSSTSSLVLSRSLLALWSCSKRTLIFLGREIPKITTGLRVVAL